MTLTNGIIPQGRVPFMERPGGSHWLECSLYLVLLFQNFTAYYGDRFEGVLLGGWMGGWMEGVFTFP